MPSPFITTRNTKFWHNDAPFFAGGVNCYFLAYCCDESRRAAMARAKELGASVIRVWAFLAVDDFQPGQLAFQYFQDGRILVNDGPDGLQRLDALIQAAEDLDIKLILPLINYWGDFGGAPAYVKWLTPGLDVTEFYRSPAVRMAYQDWVRQILTRRNTLTGRLYSEEPAIMAWELTNEARCPTAGGRELLLDWVSEMAGFVKSLDSNHLLALGDEGLFFKKGRGHLYDGCYGVDWAANLAVPEIDFGTFHFYPDTWGKRPDFARRWIEDHLAVACELNKPSLLEEFGLKQNRDHWYGRWTKTIRESGTAGGLVWMLGLDAKDTSGYLDDFVIY